MKAKEWALTLTLAGGVIPAEAVQYVTNATVTVTTELTEGLSLNGGQVDYRHSASRYLRSAILLTGASDAETVYGLAAYAGETPLHFQKDILSAAGAKLVLPCSFRFGAVSSAYNAGWRAMSDTSFGFDFWKGTGNRRAVGYSGYPYVGPDTIRFSAADAKLVLSGHAALTAWPNFPYEIALAAPDEDAATSLAFLGADMAGGDTFELTGYNVVWANPNAFSRGTTVVVPSKRYLIALRQRIDASPSRLEAVTPYLSYSTSGNTYTNDVRLAGGTFLVAEQGAWFHYGNVSGSGQVVLEAAAAQNGVIRAFRGSLDDFDGQLKVYSGAGASRMDGREQRVHLSKTFSPGHGDIYLYASTNGLTKMCFSPIENQAGDWHVGRVTSEGVFMGEEAMNGTVAGAAWELLPAQRLSIGVLSGGLAVFGKTRATLTVGTLADGSTLYLTNGVPLTVADCLGEGVRIVYGPNASGTDALTFETTGGSVREIVLSGNTVTLSGDVEIGRISGFGEVVVTGGDVRIDATGAAVEVDVREGATVAFSGAGRLADVLADARLTLWLDASDLSSYRGVPSTSKSRETYPEWRETATALGTDGLVYTNDFPLVDQWYDRRADRRPDVDADGYDAEAYAQSRFYFYNDRKARNGDLWPYPQFMPYVMTNQVNGKAVLSFDAPGASLDRQWAAKASGTVNVRRSLSLVQGAQRVYTAIMVFGSQEGGGRAVLGGYSTSAYGTANDYTRSSCSASFVRGGTATDRDRPETPIFASVRGTWLDGVEVDPCATGFSGGYQVLAFDGQANYFRTLGYSQSFPTDGTECGGARYGEILIFGGTSGVSNPLTEAQRTTVENYLAQKWGITAYRSPVAGKVTLAGGTARTLGNYAPVGSGVWEIETDAVIGPGFTGVLSGTGNVTVAEGVQPPTLDGSFWGSVAVTTNVLSFALSRDGVRNASVAPDATFVFPDKATIELLSSGGKIPPGEYALVSGASLRGLTDVALCDRTGCATRIFRLIRRENALVLDVKRSGFALIVR